MGKHQKAWHACMWKIAGSVLWRLFTSGSKRCHTISDNLFYLNQTKTFDDPRGLENIQLHSE